MPPTPEELTQQLNVAQTALNAKTGKAPATVQPTVSANEIANPPAAVQPPVPVVNTNDGSRTNNLVTNTTSNLEGVIGRDLESRVKADELNTLLGTQSFDGAGERAKLGKEYGITDNLTRLQDIQTQLAKRNTESKITQSRIEGADGQTLGQAGREITQEQREASLRDAGLAAEASVLTNSIETATSIVNNAMSDYYSDRQLKNQNLIQQLNYFSDIADGETSQLLAKEARKYEADQKVIERTLDAVDQAITSGAARPDEIRLITDPNTTDADRRAISQAVVARASKQLYDADLYGKYLSNSIKQTELNALNTPPDPTVIPSETLKTIKGLTDGQRTAVTGSRETINEINRMIALVETTGDMSLLTKATESGREFLRLRQNVVDKLARNRTGAVVGADEEKTFKDILGVGFFDVIAKDDTEVIEGLKKFRTPHEETLNLNDPTGEVRNYLDSTKVEDTDPAIQAVWGVSGGTPVTTPNSYYQ